MRGHELHWSLLRLLYGVEVTILLSKPGEVGRCGGVGVVWERGGWRAGDLRQVTRLRSNK